MRSVDATRRTASAAADSRAAQHSARDRRQFYKYLMQGRFPGAEMACHDATAHALLAELRFLLGTGIGYGPPPRSFTTIPIARARSTTAASDAPLVGRWNGSSRMPTLTINGQSHNVDADPDMPLLWALRENVG